MTDLRAAVRDLHDRAPVLVQTTVISLALFAVTLVALVIDQRELLGVPIWLKPVKFALSGAVYLAALACITRELRRTWSVRIISGIIGWLIVAEVLLVSLQAGRGVQSHFNIDTAFDVGVFSTMGTAIATVWVLSMVLLVMHVRAPVRDRAMGMALRFGLALNIVGAAVGWVMVQPQPAQLAAIRTGVHPFRAGAHTVGAPDGGAGLPLTNWSIAHGDLRVPHFIGLHALQLLPVLVLLLRAVRTRRDDAVERSLLTLAAGACTAIFLTSLLQALAGRPSFPIS